MKTTKKATLAGRRLKSNPARAAESKLVVSKVSAPAIEDAAIEGDVIVEKSRQVPGLKSLPDKRRRRRRGDDVRERVLAAARQCFGSFGFEGTSTREVAARAKVTHTLVLYHFRTKDQLWIATLEHALTPYLDEVRPLFSSSDGMLAAEALRKFIEIFVRMSAHSPDVHSILTSEGNTDSERLNWIIDHFLRDHFKNVCNIIRRGQAEGSVRECDPARLYYLIISAGGTLPSIAIEYRALTGRDVTSAPEILRNMALIYEIVFNGSRGARHS